MFILGISILLGITFIEVYACCRVVSLTDEKEEEYLYWKQQKNNSGENK